QKFRDRFESLKSRCTVIHEVRAKGAMIGIELTVPGTDVVKRCLERRLLVNCTHQTVIRLLPALNLPDDLFNEGATILEESILAPQKSPRIMRHYTDITDVSRDELTHILDEAARLKAQDRREARTPLAHRVVALVFEKPSLRTRVSFESAVVQL